MKKEKRVLTEEQKTVGKEKAKRAKSRKAKERLRLKTLEKDNKQKKHQKRLKRQEQNSVNKMEAKEDRKLKMQEIYQLAKDKKHVKGKVTDIVKTEMEKQFKIHRPGLPEHADLKDVKYNPKKKSFKVTTDLKSLDKENKDNGQDKRATEEAESAG